MVTLKDIAKEVGVSITTVSNVVHNRASRVSPELATRHLLENGHRVIAFASPFLLENGVVEKRLQGYQRALGEFGVPFDPQLVFEQEISIDDGVRLGRAL